MMILKLKAISNKTKIISTEVTSALLILLFSYTGIMKLIDHDNFQGVLSQSDLLGKWAQILAWVIPVVELITVLLLFITRTKIIGLSICIVLMCVFTFYVFYMIVFMPHLPCNCGGVIKLMSWREHLVFNVFFTMIAILGYRTTKHIENNFEIKKTFLTEDIFCAKNQESPNTCRKK